MTDAPAPPIPVAQLYKRDLAAEALNADRGGGVRCSLIEARTALRKGGFGTVLLEGGTIFARRGERRYAFAPRRDFPYGSLYSLEAVAGAIAGVK
jgi:hypothetical protein